MCLICDRIEMIKNGTNPYFVKELKTGYVVVGDNQHFYGYTLFLYKNHDHTELFQLDMEERTLFMQEMSVVAEAAARAEEEARLAAEAAAAAAKKAEKKRKAAGAFGIRRLFL